MSKIEISEPITRSNDDQINNDEQCGHNNIIPSFRNRVKNPCNSLPRAIKKQGAPTPRDALMAVLLYKVEMCPAVFTWLVRFLDIWLGDSIAALTLL